jgi:hypothetical protein
MDVNSSIGSLGVAAGDCPFVRTSSGIASYIRNVGSGVEANLVFASDAAGTTGGGAVSLQMSSKTM